MNQFAELKERSFSSEIFRPKPKYHLSSQKRTMALLTLWGSDEISSQNIFEEIESQYNFLSEDVERTHPLPKLQSLSPAENNMRTAVISANQNIFNSLNQSEYVAGFELIYVTIEGNICTCVQIGQPSLLLDSAEVGLQSISPAIDLSFNYYSANKKDLAPLPHSLLGIHEDISFHPFSFRFHAKDRLIFLSRNGIPCAWFSTKREDRNLDHLSRLAVQEKPQSPFWLALLQFQ